MSMNGRAVTNLARKSRSEVLRRSRTTETNTLRGKSMDWRIFITTFGVIFLAEMGDKTQLAAMTMSAETKRPWIVLVSASLALACVSAIGVLVGSLLSNYLPLEWIKRGAAIAFIAIGTLILLGKF